MAKLELSRSLAMSAGDAWQHVSDLNSLGDWMTMHQGWRSELPDELAVGTTIVGVAGAKGMGGERKAVGDGLMPFHTLRPGGFAGSNPRGIRRTGIRCAAHRRRPARELRRPPAERGACRSSSRRSAGTWRISPG